MRRKHRFLTAPSGLTLLVCLFLPAVRACDQPVYPIEMPLVYPPYILGPLIALAAVVTGAGLRSAAMLLRGAVFATGALLFFVSFLGIPYSLPLLIPSCILMGVAANGRSNERLAMHLTITVGALAILWFGPFSFSKDSLYGVQLSLASSLGVLAGGLWWRRELAYDDDLADYEVDEPVEVPLARAKIHR